MRWKHHKYGMLSPVLFIPVFEKYKLIHIADLCVFERVCQFLKDGASSEIKALTKFKKNCKLMYYGEALKFIQMMSPSEFKTCKVIENRLFIKACDSDTDLVVFDEVLDLIDYGILDEQMLLYYLDNRGNTEVVLTGRNPGLKIKKRADYITKMFSEKHPFDKGEPAREGVEF